MCRRLLFFLAVLLVPVGFPAAQSSASGEVRWYRSNSSGIALEFIPSRLAALRNEYCISVERPDPNRIPGVIIYYYYDAFTVELRILYENRKEVRRQWVFRDSSGLARLSSSGSPGFFAGVNAGEEESINGFIEIRNREGFITRELHFDEDRAEWEFVYSYRDGILISAETWYKEPPLPPPIMDETEESEESEEEIAEAAEAEESEHVEAVITDAIAAAEETESAGEGISEGDLASSGGIAGKSSGTAEYLEPVFVLICTDYYRYSRPGSLRAIERIINREAGDITRIPFPRIGPGGPQVGEILVPRIAYVPEFLIGVYSSAGERVDYTIDGRGRVLTEVWKDEDSRVIGEIINSWDGDRLASILWESREQVLLVEYEYDGEGNRIVERNFRQGVLERSVANRGGLDIEEIYVNGRLMLRAVWEKGLKISEERIQPPGGSR